MTCHRIISAALLAAGCGLEPSGPGGRRDNDFDLVCNVPSRDVFFGGALRDGIPALTNPEAVRNGQETRIRDDDRVLALVVNGTARAYPFGVLWHHEVVNDTLGGRNVLVSYCPLTGSGIAFDPRVEGGPSRNFGVSGLLYENNLMMFDRETETLWNQMHLGSICGPERGKGLALIPIVETTWGHWKTLHPNTTVMTYNTGVIGRPYGVYPYGNYRDLDNSSRSFPGSSFSTVRPPKESVLGVVSGSESVALPFGILSRQGAFGVVLDSVGGMPFVATWVGPEQTAIAYDRRVDSLTLTFTVYGPGVREFVDAETGSVWNERGEAVSGPLAGRTLRPVPDSFVAFWFAWSVYYPDIKIID